MIHLPSQVHIVLERLTKAGFEAYIVGGCVRDHLRGCTPSDYDITTAALPDEIAAVFSDLRVIETGIKHGTVTVLIDRLPLEITTYRLESGYSDHRHPDEVRFTSSLKEDLARRDFTINAMAYHPDKGLVDYFGGREDLAKHVIRCVGVPERRFEEDALRIMRALRFSSVLGFEIEEATKKAAFSLKDSLSFVSQERLATELVKLLCGQDAGKIILQYVRILGVFLPELLPMEGHNQYNPYHIYDILEHTARVVDGCPREKTLRLAGLFHDVGKPRCFTRDDQGIGHFRGHPVVGADMVDAILRRMKFDNATRERVVELIHWHDAPLVPTEKTLRRIFKRIPPEIFFPLLDLKRADAMAQNPAKVDPGRIDILLREAKALLAKQPCFTVKDLAVKGRDLIELGMEPSKELGETLNWLLDAVIAEEVPNQKQALLEHWKKHR